MNWLEKDQNNGNLSWWNKKWDLKGEHTTKNAFSYLSFTEKFIIGLLLIVFVSSSFYMLSKVSRAFMIEVPLEGGSLTEGIIGSPRFINPLFAETDADKDLTALVYSGLLRPDPEEGLVKDLAESYSISEDGLVYNFKLKNNTYFHDGEKVTSEDIEFTVKKAQDLTIKSPRRVNWEGVEVSVLNDREISFTLSQPYAPFLENATLGILPKHLWENLEPEQFTASLLNMEPIGSGPYEIDKIKRSSDGLPIFYEFQSFDKYTLGEPYIKKLTIKMFSNEEELVDALEGNDIESANSIYPDTALRLKKERNDLNMHSVILPRIFGLFFNQNQAGIFTHIEVRKALNTALDKERLVEEILSGLGTEIKSPIPKIYSEEESFEKQSREERLSEARDILERNGWEIDSESGLWEKGGDALSFSISTHDIEDLRQAAEILKEQWAELGVPVEIKLFDRSDFTQNIIRPRRYEALLFGTIIGRDLDLFPFWHSSSRNDPGLNVALYANIETDKLLEEARILTDNEEQLEKYREFEETLLGDYPAIFLYSPDFIYLLPSKVKNIKLGHITTADDRFANVYEWFIDTNRVWEVLHSEKN